MATFPLSQDDAPQDALNYLLSGPAGLGQNFKGFSAYSPGYLTGNFRPPFTTQTIVRFSLGNDTESTIKVYPEATGISVGAEVSGYGIAPGTKVASIGSLVTGITIVEELYTSYVEVTLDTPLIGDVDTQLFFYPLYPAVTYVAPIALSTSSMPSGSTFKFEFASTQPTPPFTVGQIVIVDGTSDSWYNDSYGPIGVVECTTEYAICRVQSTYAIEPPATGGTIFYSVVRTSTPYLGAASSTDCNGKVTITGATDRVFLSAQLNNIISYSVDSGSKPLQYVVQLNRYIGAPTSDPINPEYRFNIQKTISQKTYDLTLTGTGSLDNIETTFNTVIDQPAPAYYWYILEVMFYAPDGGLEITQSELDVRSLSAQVVKE